MLVLRHRRLLAAVAALAAGLAAFVLLYFEPQKLFIDDVVHEAPPALPAPASGSATASGSAPATRTLSTGAFRSYEHATSGRARVLELPGGRRYVRFDRFRTSNGPALKVYLSAAPATGPGDAFDDRYVDLGDLKGNIGEQNYAIPRRVDLSRYRSVVVWCVRFHVPFGAAAL
jgi:Electron transfer DM13